MNRVKLILLTLVMIVTLTIGGLTGCIENNDNPDGSDDKLQIITTLFPNYDFAKHITQGTADVTLLLPPGVEAHSYDPKPKDLLKIHDADIFIYTSNVMEPWANKIINTLNSEEQIIIASSNNIETSDVPHTHEEGEEHHNHDHQDMQDPHIWVNPVYAIQMVKNILDAIIEADPENAEFYRNNAAEYIEELSDLDSRLAEALAKVENRTIIYAGHFVFGYFTQRYNLDHSSPYKGYAPDSEPTQRNISELITLMESLDVKTIYYEELTEPRIAKVISEQTGAQMILLHGLHNVSKEDLQSDVTYIDLMNQNLGNLKLGLGYNE